MKIGVQNMELIRLITLCLRPISILHACNVYVDLLQRVKIGKIVGPNLTNI